MTDSQDRDPAFEAYEALPPNTTRTPLERGPGVARARRPPRSQRTGHAYSLRLRFPVLGLSRGLCPDRGFFFVAVLRQSCCTTPSAQSGLPFPQSRPPLVVAAGARAQRYTCARSLTPAALLARYSRQANVSRKDNTHFSYLSFRTKVSRE
jgi:hypothetical protein